MTDYYEDEDEYHEKKCNKMCSKIWGCCYFFCCYCCIQYKNTRGKDMRMMDIKE